MRHRRFPRQRGSDLKRVEVVPLYACNARCGFCPSWRQDHSIQIGWEIVSRHLQRYRKRGATEVDFGGGEPTLRRDLLRSIRAARALGYERIGLITNGWRLADPKYTAACVEEGLTRVTFSVWGFDEDSHALLSRCPGTYGLLFEGIRNAAQAGLERHANLMCTSVTWDRMGDMAEVLACEGVADMCVHVASAYGLERDEASASLVPDLRQAGEGFRRASERVGGRARVWTTQIPPCLLAPYRDGYVHSRELDMTVQTPRASFRAEDSPYEGGQKVEACSRCSWSGRCNGLRPECIRMGIGPTLSPIPPEVEAAANGGT